MFARSNKRIGKIRLLWSFGVGLRKRLNMKIACCLSQLIVATVLSTASPSLAGPLQDAIVAGNLDSVRLEIDRGGDVNEADLMLGLPLMIAAQNNHVAIAKLLIAKGADVNGWDVSGTALHAGARVGHTEIVEILIASGADLDAMPDGRTTALHQAAQNGHVNTMELLIQHGASVDLKPKIPSALWLAAGSGHVEAVKILLANGANIQNQDRYFQTTLHRAVRGGHISVVKVLLDAGADIGAISLDHNTPLMFARQFKRSAIAELLIQRGATQ